METQTAPRKGLWRLPIAPVRTEIEANRIEFRAARKPTWLKGWLHFRLILLLGAGTTALSAWLVRRPMWWEWASIPAGFFIANFVEWLAHRYPMHHPWPGLKIAYEMHTLKHHRVFTHDAMEAESPDDFDMVLFSPLSLSMFLFGTGLPVALLFFAFVSWNAGWIFVALAVDYYVLYECCHMAYHLPESSWVGRLPGMALLRRHHTHHHDLELMSHWNFNVTFPIFDRVFGTHWERAQK
jgi:sterol desaturase/sphingolipid hydroxylase (fatty acid hydroxylase superfamily)